jgi:broad-specificity NMP kinase
MTDENKVGFNIDKESLLSILRTAASRERTVVEFQTVERHGERQLDQAIDITEHVKQLEENS